MIFEIAFKATVGTFHLDVALEWDGPLALVGPNGSGKTTVLKVITGAVEPDAGTIGSSTAKLVDTASGVCLPPEQRRVGYVPQGGGLFGHLSVLANVGYGLRWANLSRAEQDERARTMLAELGCLELASKPTRGLSGGEVQKVALARALVRDPDILLLDEPLSALDVQNRRQTREFLVEAVRGFAGTSVWVTHDVRDLRLLDSMAAVLDRGKVVATGTHDELGANPPNEFVREFIAL